jgi:hypothetical protein
MGRQSRWQGTQPDAPEAAKFTAEYRPSLLNGVEIVTGKAVALA